MGILTGIFSGMSKRQKTIGFVGKFGAPEGIRTPDLCLRRAALYPAELRAREGLDSGTPPMRQRLAVAKTIEGRESGLDRMDGTLFALII
jgi:hypothetical protein